MQGGSLYHFMMVWPARDAIIKISMVSVCLEFPADTQLLQKIQKGLNHFLDFFKKFIYIITLV